MLLENVFESPDLEKPPSLKGGFLVEELYLTKIETKILVIIKLVD